MSSFQLEKIVDDIENINFSIHVYSKFLENFPIFPLAPSLTFFSFFFSRQSTQCAFAKYNRNQNNRRIEMLTQWTTRKKWSTKEFMELMILVLSFFTIHNYEIILIFSRKFIYLSYYRKNIEICHTYKI